MMALRLDASSMNDVLFISQTLIEIGWSSFVAVVHLLKLHSIIALHPANASTH
jgi:hypothetical protein